MNIRVSPPEVLSVIKSFPALSFHHTCSLSCRIQLLLEALPFCSVLYTLRASLVYQLA